MEKPMKVATAPQPSPVTVEIRDAIAVVRLSRPHKRNALNEASLLAMEAAFAGLPASVKVAVLLADGDHFCAGLDLSELAETGIGEAIRHSRMWHRVTEAVEFGPVPVISVLHGAVVGGGMELASATHVRVAERTAYYALPEGQRGIYVGGGGSVRLPRLIGMSRMMEMMLTGRVLSAEEGERIGLSHYVVEAGEGEAKAFELAAAIARNTSMTNFALIQGLPRIADTDRSTGYLVEALLSSVAQDDDEAKQRLQAFLEKRSPKISHRG
jgi:enoyl-CoA hydratase/carnithine racemase